MVSFQLEIHLRCNPFNEGRVAVQVQVVKSDVVNIVGYPGLVLISCRIHNPWPRRRSCKGLRSIKFRVVQVNTMFYLPQLQLAGAQHAMGVLVVSEGS
jgi:hypothetical protein